MFSRGRNRNSDDLQHIVHRPARTDGERGTGGRVHLVVPGGEWGINSISSGYKTHFKNQIPIIPDPSPPNFFPPPTPQSQLYIYKDRALTEKIVRRAERAGFSALVLTVDAPLFGRRRADERNAFQLPSHLR